MNYSLSTFTLDINGKPTLVLQTKWHAHAEELCHDWVQSHWDELSTKGPYGADLPPAVRVRMARAAEKAAYEANADRAEIFRNETIVMLTGAGLSDELRGSHGEPIKDGEPKLPRPAEPNGARS